MKDETSLEAFLNIARQYCEAANVLFNVNSTKKQNPLLLLPIYMLYFHATELALKGFLRHKGVKTEDLKKRNWDIIYLSYIGNALKRACKLLRSLNWIYTT